MALPSWAGTVFELPEFMWDILNFLSAPLCHPNCFSCKNLELDNNRALARGFLRCNRSIAGVRNEVRPRLMHNIGSGFAMGWRVLPVPVVVFERMDESSHRNFRLRKSMRDIMEATERAANLEVQVAEESADDLSPRAARRIYNEVTWCLEQCQNILSSDTSDEVRSNYHGRAMHEASRSHFPVST